LQNAIGFYEPGKHRLVALVWRGGDIENADVAVHRADALVTLTFAAGSTRTVRYVVASAPDSAAAKARLRPH
jgi:hypothetical protein